jgi:hypothetical protein
VNNNRQQHNARTRRILVGPDTLTQFFFAAALMVAWSSRGSSSAAARRNGDSKPTLDAAYKLKIDQKAKAAALAASEHCDSANDFFKKGAKMAAYGFWDEAIAAYTGASERMDKIIFTVGRG